MVRRAVPEVVKGATHGTQEALQGVKEATHGTQGARRQSNKHAPDGATAGTTVVGASVGEGVGASVGEGVVGLGVGASVGVPAQTRAQR
jgi:hypothetical protein